MKCLYCSYIAAHLQVLAASCSHAPDILLMGSTYIFPFFFFLSQSKALSYTFFLKSSTVFLTTYSCHTGLVTFSFIFVLMISLKTWIADTLCTALPCQVLHNKCKYSSEVKAETKFQWLKSIDAGR